MNQHSETNFTRNLTPTALRGIAGITSVTSAIAAYPIAADLFGMVAGGVMVASSAAVIYAGWHYVGTETDTSDNGIMKRIGAGVMASAFAVAMVAGIHASADLSHATTATSAAAEADKLYSEQEAARMSALASMTAELRDTQKSKYPAEYASLQKQVEKLSTPTPRTATASQITQGLGTASTAYQWGVASVFEVVTPALLLLAGMFSRRNPKLLITEASTIPATLSTPTATLDRNPQPLAVEEVEKTATPYELLKAMRVKPDLNGFVTVAMIRAAAFGCTDWQAREAIKEAHAMGILDKSGEGGATRYTYKTTLRAVK